MSSGHSPMGFQPCIAQYDTSRILFVFFCRCSVGPRRTLRRETSTSKRFEVLADWDRQRWENVRTLRSDVMASDSLRDDLESEYSYVTDSTGSDPDTIDELLRRFTCKFSPSYVLKLRDQHGPVVYGADITCDSELRPSLAIMVKPVDRNFWLRRVRIDQNYDISVRSRKLAAWVFTLDLEAEVNPKRGSRDIGFRIATAWDATNGKVRKKSKFHPLEGAHAAVEWEVNYSLPEMRGRFSGESSGMETSLGYAHGEVSKLELSLWPRFLARGHSKNKEGGNTDVDEMDRTPAVEREPSFLEQFVSRLAL